MHMRDFTRHSLAAFVKGIQRPNLGVLVILLLASVLPKVSTLKIYCERSQAPKTSLSIWFNCCPRSVRVHSNSGFVGIEK